LSGSFVTIGTSQMHADCFTCANCNTGLAGVPFMASGVQTGSGYLCKPCYVRENCETCAYCNEAITSGSMVSAGGKKYHSACYEKKQSGVGFTAAKQTTPEGAKVSTKPTCTICNQEITSGAVRIGGKPFHQACFKCSGCQTPLNGKPFFDVDGSYMCKTCAEDSQYPTCFACGELIKSSGFMEDAQGNKYHGKCYSQQTKANADTCARCNKLITKGALVRARDLSGNLTGEVYHKACHEEKVREDERAAADKIRAGGAAAVRAPVAQAPKSFSEIEKTLEDGTGLLVVGGETHTVTRQAPASGPTVQHAGSMQLPPEMERDLAKVGADKTAARMATHAATTAELEGMVVNGIRFNKNSFCNKDMTGEVKGKTVVIGKQSGTYRVKNGEIDVSWKDKKFTHRDWTNGQASKEERIRPIQHEKLPLP